MWGKQTIKQTQKTLKINLTLYSQAWRSSIAPISALQWVAVIGISWPRMKSKTSFATCPRPLSTRICNLGHLQRSGICVNPWGISSARKWMNILSYVEFPTNWYCSADCETKSLPKASDLRKCQNHIGNSNTWPAWRLKTGRSSCHRFIKDLNIVTKASDLTIINYSI